MNNQIVLTGAVLASLVGTANSALPPCGTVSNLPAAIECVKQNEPSYRSALSGEEEASTLKSSAYRLINPELEVEYSDGQNLGDVQRAMSATLLFNFEMGGKRSARARILEAEGLSLKADAFEQQVEALTDLGASLLRVHQLEAEKGVLQESLSAFRRVIGLYRSRGALPPEQRVSLHTFELVILEYERKSIEVDASLLKYRKRVEQLFGREAKGVPLVLKDWPLDPEVYRKDFNTWVDNSPEMLRVQADAIKAEGEFAAARADLWPNLQVGPSIARATDGPTSYNTYGFRAVIPLPILSRNTDERTSRKATSARVQSHLAWTRQDVRSKYESMLNELSRIQKLLAEVPDNDSIQRKHSQTESLYQRGMISGALMIETHRAMVEHLTAKHELQAEYLEGLLTLRQLERMSR